MEKHRPEDDLFKKILENHPDFEPSKSALNDMKNRLDGADNSNQKSGFGIWWLPLLLLPFIFATGFLFFQNQKLNNQVQELNSKLLTLQKDTIQQKYITYHFDTIYNITYVDQNVERKIAGDYQKQSSPILNYLSDNAKAFALQSPNDFFILKNNDLEQKPFIYSDGNTFTTLQSYNFSQEKIQGNSIKNSPKDRFGNSIETSREALSIASLFYFLERDKDVNVLLGNLDPTFEFKKRRRNPIHFFTPKEFRVGISGSPFSLTKIRPNTFRPANSYGIESEISFNKNVRLLLGLRKMDLSFEEKDPLHTDLYPSIMPYDPTDKFRELYVTLNHIQIPISLKYLFSTDKKWQPFFSVGMVANRPFQQKFKHKLISTSLEEYEISQNYSEGAFSVKNIQGAVGLEFNFTSKLSSHAEVYYLHDFELNVGEYFLLRNAGVNIGIKYRL